MINLVLLGGGHSHVIFLKLWAKKPLAEVNLILINDTSHTPYSGMLPGHIAGFYSYEETHINLIKLANFAQAKFYQDRALDLDLENKRVFCQENSWINFDYLSIDIGSIPNVNHLPGVKDFAIPIKPVANFLNYWSNFLETIKNSQNQPISLGIVGGGAGGVELALNVDSKLKQLVKKDNLEIHLFHRGDQLLPDHNQWVSQRLEKILIERKIQLHLEETVSSIADYNIICQSGLTIKCQPIFWVTQASAQAWIKASGLTTDERGFILVKDTLQSLSHPEIFAAGDIATMVNYNCPKAGVVAVRQGKPLFNNLQAIILGKSLQNYRPQKRFLALIGTGDQQAIASWGSWGFQSRLFWFWKDYIDRQFMQEFI